MTRMIGTFLVEPRSEMMRFRARAMAVPASKTGKENANEYNKVTRKPTSDCVPVTSTYSGTVVTRAYTWARTVSSGAKKVQRTL